MRCTSLAVLLLAVLAGATVEAAQPTTQMRDHYVTVISNEPAMAGQKVRIYLHERASAQVLAHGAGNEVVLFVHGALTPAEVAFDVPYQDYSWMGYLPQAGYDVFAVDMLGYGRSTRPAPMNDKCNLAPMQQPA